MVEQSYFGSHATVLDEAGRITVPKRFREIMEHFDRLTWYLTPGLNGNLYLYNREQWHKLLGRNQARFEEMDQDTHQFFSFGYGFSHETRVDRQGRMPIPPQLREMMGLDREVVLVGVQDRLELWKKEDWEVFCRAMWPTFGKKAKDLAPGPVRADSAV